MGLSRGHLSTNLSTTTCRRCRHHSSSTGSSSTGSGGISSSGISSSGTSSTGDFAFTSATGACLASRRRRSSPGTCRGVRQQALQFDGLRTETHQMRREGLAPGLEALQFGLFIQAEIVTK
jgi:hypothetical protein